MKQIAIYGNFTNNMVECLQDICPSGFTLYRADTDNITTLKYADYLINRGHVVDYKVLDAAPSLRLIQRWGVGYDRVDIRTAGIRNIPVAICTGGNSLPVAELTVALALDLLRHVIPLAIDLKGGNWSQERYASRSYLLSGKTIGLIGIGHVARKVAAIVKNGFQCKVLYHDICRLSCEQEATLGLYYRDLDSLLQQSDIVSIHVPLLPSTKNMITWEKLTLMKPTACLINTSRGGVIHEADLVRALKQGIIMGAGLDTFATEPLPKDSAFLTLDNVVVTPHCAGNTVDNDTNMASTCMRIISHYDQTHDQTMAEIVNRQFLSMNSSNTDTFH